MTRRATLRLIVGLAVLAATGCATTAPSSTPPAVTSPPPAPLAGEPVRLPPPVEENDTFVTIDGRAAYKIGGGDVLDVLLAKDLAQDRQTVEVTPAGRVTLGFFEVAVAGLTVEQAAAAIHRALAPTHRELSVTVTVKEYRARTVSVIGEVQNTTQVALRGRTTLLDLLVSAGGLRPQADVRELRLVRRGGQTYTIDLHRLVAADGDRLHHLVVDAGDIVFVPGKRTDEQKVFLIGEVHTPGGYVLVPDMRLSHALAVAGGPKESARLESARVIRGDLQNLRVIEVDFERALAGTDRTQDLVLERNDVIVVPRSTIANWNAFLAKLKPTLEFLSLPLAPVSQYLLLRELIR
jgi:polysaccharide export outer membrane protein